MKTAIFGGSFDPVHLGHIEIVKKALKNLYIDKLIIMPNYLNPLKHNFSAPPEIRLKWLKKVFKNFDKVEISDFEINQNRPVYTIETIEKFKPTYFIIGSDNLNLLDKWKNIDKLKNMVEFVVATRGEVNNNLQKKYNIKKVLKMNIPISSTEIRKGNFKYLPKEIESEIKEFYGQNFKN
ncbi:nicotinate (nicotinamide) nucleotide adenylyltransferase [Caminibacter mediatlanticus TB-2]|uniref:Probable nicotinate-nucleotide adenylyltransferase n=1 Tax=Caminibacter mediatlanticus TB-2 TaxID=391592 RepID=A0ABX5VA18_9BACT|nr:nicotinate (nicotinamide) nucleotide adenylyltransferase [Caminibacter mediatlanticus]QCT94222.1 nicotinate (nicotinamide) nucleotide adenylyltransferase [Caminibacter mediatlanticus TB-2]